MEEVPVENVQIIEKEIHGEGPSIMNVVGCTEVGENYAGTAEMVEIQRDNVAEVGRPPDNIGFEEGEGLSDENSLSPLSPSPLRSAANEGVGNDSWQGSCEEALDDEEFYFEEWDETNNNVVEIAGTVGLRETDKGIKITSADKKSSGVLDNVKFYNSCVEREEESLLDFSFESLNDALVCSEDERKCISHSQEVNNNV